MPLQVCWDSFGYDAELDLLYVGVGNSSQYNRTKRSPGGGDNLFLASILAVDPDNGELKWHYQTTPAEHWDYTATQHMILATLDVQGKPTKVIMQAPENGFFYVLNRENGEVIAEITKGFRRNNDILQTAEVIVNKTEAAS